VKKSRTPFGKRFTTKKMNYPQDKNYTYMFVFVPEIFTRRKSSENLSPIGTEKLVLIGVRNISSFLEESHVKFAQELGWDFIPVRNFSEIFCGNSKHVANNPENSKKPPSSKTSEKSEQSPKLENSKNDGNNLEHPVEFQRYFPVLLAESEKIIFTKM